MQRILTVTAKRAANGGLDISHHNARLPSGVSVENVLAISVPLVVTSQLGILLPELGCALCARLVGIFGGHGLTDADIPSSLKEVQIDLHYENKIALITLEPKFDSLATKQDEAIGRFVANYAYQILNTSSEKYMKFIMIPTVVAMKVYVSEALPTAFPLEDNGYFPSMHRQMLAHAPRVSEFWGRDMAFETISQHLSDIASTLKQYLPD